MDNQKIGNFIKELRKEKGLTQKDLADKLRITDRAISKWERGLNCPDISLLDDLSKILDVSVVELLKGRKLEPNELVSNKELIESMNYANRTLKQQIEKMLNSVCTFIIILLIIILLLNNIKSIIYTHKKFKVSYYDYPTSLTDNFMDEYFSKIDLIEKNQGIYTDEEYDLIIKFVNDLKQVSNKNIEKEIALKKELTLIDYKNFVNGMYIYDVDGYDGFVNNYNDIYKIILKYDIDKYERLNNYNNSKIMYKNVIFELSDVFKKAYIYNYKNYNYDGIDIDYTTYIKIAIELKYNANNMILTDIVEVGEIYE